MSGSDPAQVVVRIRREYSRPTPVDDSGSRETPVHGSLMSPWCRLVASRSNKRCAGSSFLSVSIDHAVPVNPAHRPLTR